MAGQNNFPFIINVGNSIIGVTILAMPFCFKACGIILGSLLLLFSTWLTLVSCQLLLKAGVTSRRRSYSFLAYYTHGAIGKLIVEIGMIGLQLGTLVAQVVIIGDLGPAIVSKATGLPNTHNLRTGLIILLCLFLGLPLGLLKDVRMLSKTSTLCILFYTFFSFYVIIMSIPNLVRGQWYSKVTFWRMEGFFQCLPIFSFAFGCQTQMFIVYDALAEPSLKRMNNIVSSAVNMCAVAYLLVGFFGNVAFCDIEISGDIINHFQQNSISDGIKLCFVFSIAVSIPLIVFPCRVSLYNLLFPQRPKEDIPGSGKIPEFHFRVITIFIIVGSMVIGIMVPNVEFVLGLNGATMGTLICYIFPALFFINVMASSSDGKWTAKLVLVFGLTILIASTYTTLNTQEKKVEAVRSEDIQVTMKPADTMKPAVESIQKTIEKIKPPLEENKKEDAGAGPPVAIDSERKEPPNPQAPAEEEMDKDEKPNDILKEIDKKEDKVVSISKKDKDTAIDKDTGGDVDKKDTDKEKKDGKKIGEGDEKVVKVIEEKDQKATKDKEDKEKLAEKEKKQEEILGKLAEQQEEQQKLIQEQKQILEELKQHKEEHIEKDKKEASENKDKQNALNAGQEPLQNQQLGGQQLQNKQLGIESPVQGQQLINQQGLINQPVGLQPVQNQQESVHQILQNQQLGGQQPLQNQQLGGQQPLQNQQLDVQQQLQNQQQGSWQKVQNQQLGGQQQAGQQQLQNQQVGNQPVLQQQAGQQQLQNLQVGNQPVLQQQAGQQQLQNQQVGNQPVLQQQAGQQQLQNQQVGNQPVFQQQAGQQPLQNQQLDGQQQLQNQPLGGQQQVQNQPPVQQQFAGQQQLVDQNQGVLQNDLNLQNLQQAPQGAQQAQVVLPAGNVQAGNVGNIGLGNVQGQQQVGNQGGFQQEQVQQAAAGNIQHNIKVVGDPNIQRAVNKPIANNEEQQIGNFKEHKEEPKDDSLRRRKRDIGFEMGPYEMNGIVNVHGSENNVDQDIDPKKEINGHKDIQVSNDKLIVEIKDKAGDTNKDSQKLADEVVDEDGAREENEFVKDGETGNIQRDLRQIPTAVKVSDSMKVVKAEKSFDNVDELIDNMKKDLLYDGNRKSPFIIEMAETNAGGKRR